MKLATRTVSSESVRWRHLATAGVLLLASLAGASRVNAGITDDDRYTFSTAHSLRSGEVLLGVTHLELGIHDRLEVGTNFLGDLVGAANFNLKLNLLRTTNVALAVEVGVVYLRSDHSLLRDLLPKGVKYTETDVPVSELVSVRLAPGHYLHVSGTYVYQAYKKEQDGRVVSATTGVAATGANLMYELDFADGDALLLSGGFVHLDRYLPQAFASWVFGWPIFHLELGGGVGPVPFAEDINGLLTSRAKLGFIPRVQLWWRF